MTAESSQHSTPRAWRVQWIDCERNGKDDYLAYFQATRRAGGAPKSGEEVVAAADYDRLVEQNESLQRELADCRQAHEILDELGE